MTTKPIRKQTDFLFLSFKIFFFLIISENFAMTFSRAGMPFLPRS